MYNYKSAGAAIEPQRATLADAIYDRQRQIQPGLDYAYDAAGHEKSRRDTGYHLAYLTEALLAARPVLFVDYIAWTRSVLKDYGIPTEHLKLNLVSMQQVLRERLPAPLQPGVDDLLGQAILHLEQTQPQTESFISSAAPLGPLARQYLDALLAGNRQQASTMIMEAVAAGAPIRDIYLHVFQPIQYEIGRLWQTNQISVAHEHFATAVTQLVMAQLYPHIFDTPKHGRRLVATCVSDELHELGMRMVADFFEMDGWDTFYLGANTPATSIIRFLKETPADVLAISATLTLHVSQVARLISQIRPESEIRIMVGGYPFNISSDLWREVGADGYAPSADSALLTAAKLVA